MPARKKSWSSRRRDAMVRKGDILFTGGKPDDMVIVVMGPTGVGKSSFINAFLGDNVTNVSHDLNSCTSNLQHVTAQHPFFPSCRMIIVDTPGFDDTYLDDAEILRRISVWLAESYSCDMKLAGVIYLHDITKTRMLGSTIKNLQVFRKLCGDDALSSVILGTTKWTKLTDSAVGEERLKQLRDEFWKDMIKGGSSVFKFEGTQVSAKAMIEHLLQKHYVNYDVLKLQKELVDYQKLLPETGAAMQLRHTLEEFMKMTKGKASPELLHKASAAIQALSKLPFSHQLKLRIGLHTAFRPSSPSDFLIHSESHTTSTTTVTIEAGTEDFFSVDPATPMVQRKRISLGKGDMKDFMPTIGECDEHGHTFVDISPVDIAKERSVNVGLDPKADSVLNPGLLAADIKQQVSGRRVSKVVTRTVHRCSTSNEGTLSGSHDFEVHTTAMVDLGDAASVTVNDYSKPSNVSYNNSNVTINVTYHTCLCNHPK